MFKFVIVLVLILAILYILRSRAKKNANMSPNTYRKIIIIIIVLGALFLIATSGRYLLPQILQLIKVGIPFLTKFIGI